MSADVESESSGTMIRCASCGIAEVDNVKKLKTCTGCKSVRYCGVQCQREHRPQHKKECKKRAAELRDELLFKQPESSHRGDCPICFLPLSLDNSKSVMMACCSKSICHGCAYANLIRQREVSLKSTCPFCRHPAPTSQAQAGMIEKNRIEANDPVAMCQMGNLRYEEGNFKSAVEYFSKAAEMDSLEAHYGLSVMYREGHGVEKDKKKEVYHLEQAAIGGHDLARHNLGCDEEDNGRHERAVKHYIIGANLGNDRSLVALKDYFTRGLVSKEDFATALRAHQAAIDATKSPQREAASTKEAIKQITGGR